MRRQSFVTISAEGRDKGKTYRITEMSADAAEWWAVRALLALGKSGVDLPGDPMSVGAQALAQVGFEALFKLDPDDVKPLFDEMWRCIDIVPDPKRPEVTVPIGVGQDDIEEVTTRAQLRMEVFTLHTGFSLPAVTSGSLSSATATGSSATQTSQVQSVRSSPPARRR